MDSLFMLEVIASPSKRSAPTNHNYTIYIRTLTLLGQSLQVDTTELRILSHLWHPKLCLTTYGLFRHTNSTSLASIVSAAMWGSCQRTGFAKAFCYATCGENGDWSFLCRQATKFPGAEWQVLRGLRREVDMFWRQVGGFLFFVERGEKAQLYFLIREVGGGGGGKTKVRKWKNVQMKWVVAVSAAAGAVSVAHCKTSSFYIYVYARKK